MTNRAISRRLRHTARQTHAYAQIVRLRQEVLDTMSYFSLPDNQRRIEKMEELMRVHFPADWEREQGRAMIKRRGSSLLTLAA